MTPPHPQTQGGHDLEVFASRESWLVQFLMVKSGQPESGEVMVYSLTGRAHSSGSGIPTLPMNERFPLFFVHVILLGWRGAS